eukprot:TRINITY_DN5687_c0_g3_i1.p1 TRINITY_DN5687_c0_g3~~TRINITY_DN5687_c0_g3_i1.p1  ORF type:complete len:621 (-),score=50.44 TRINITY_DN5687_c0_g3_i1:236-2098(-)
MSSYAQWTFEEASQQKMLSLPPRCLYPCCVIHVEDFLKLKGAPLPHQELLTLSLIKQWQRGKVGRNQKRMFTSFVSHQWLAKRTPDPRGQQLDALRHLLQNGFDIIDGMANFMDGVKSLTIADRQQVVNGWLWYDYFAIPQFGIDYSSACSSAFMAAVQSIAGYVQLCDIFIALTPTMSHENGSHLSFASWYSRGWCAAELSFWALRMPFKKQIMVRVHSSTKATCEAASSWLRSPVCTGDFTVEEDRVVVCELLRNMMRECCAELVDLASQRGSEAKMIDAGLLLGYGEPFMCGLPPPTENADESKSISSMLPCVRTLQYSDWLEMVEWPKLFRFGWTPAHLHAICGDITRLRACIAAEGAGMLETKIKYPSFVTLRVQGLAPLHIAAFTSIGDPISCVKELLAQRSQRSNVDVDVALWAAGYSITNSSSVGVVRELVRGRADVHSSGLFLGTESALTFAARHGNHLVSQEMIDQKADVNRRNNCGFTCLHVAADMDNFLDSSDTVLTLLRARADVNAEKTMPSIAFVKLFEATQIIRRKGGCRSELVQHVALFGGRGATALQIAAFSGNWDVCSALLEHLASPEACTRTGHTPMDVARLCGHDESFQSILCSEAAIWV